MPHAMLDQFSQIQIVKTGRHETFVDDSGEYVSLGDVVRSTSLLRCFARNHSVTWLTSAEASPLVVPGAASQVRVFTDFSQIEDSGLVINLEKTELPTFSRATVVGFVRSHETWRIRDLSGTTYSVLDWKRRCAEIGIFSWGGCLQQLLNARQEKTYGIFPRPDVKIEADIGLNWNVGGKWPSKAASETTWEKIASAFSPHYTISWQRGLNSLEEYARWIASNRVIISLDSLGLHLAMAMEVPAVGLFGATDASFFDKSPYAAMLNFDVPRETHSCLPCWRKTCDRQVHCSRYLPLHQLQIAVKSFLA